MQGFFHTPVLLYTPACLYYNNIGMLLFIIKHVSVAALAVTPKFLQLYSLYSRNWLLLCDVRWLLNNDLSTAWYKLKMIISYK